MYPERHQQRWYCPSSRTAHSSLYILVSITFMRMISANARISLSRCAPAASRCSQKPTTLSQSAFLRLNSSRANPERNTNTSGNKPSSLLDSMAEHYANLRWRFATSLTESLPKEKQAELLDRLNLKPRQEEESQTTTKQVEEQQQHSIQEAIAAAKAEEAQRQKAKWEREKEELLAEAEKAAKARVENELLIQHRRLAFERWQEDLNGGDTKKQEAQEQAEPGTSSAVVEEPVAVRDHPVLGSAISDLGYKRVHIASVQALKSLPVWKKQRIYRHSRAKSMAQDKLKTLHLGMPGIIALHEDLNGTLSIIDGQHRVGMMTILEEMKQKSEKDIFDLERILVEVYPEDKQDQQGEDGTSSTHAQDIFLEINKAEPIKLVDLPGVVLSKSDRKTINEGATRINDAFPEMFSSSQRCRAPHLNLDNLRDALFASDVVKRHNLKTPKALETWILEQNKILKEQYTHDKNKAVTVSKTALEKATKNDFFLGLDSSWLYY